MSSSAASATNKLAMGGRSCSGNSVLKLRLKPTSRRRFLGAGAAAGATVAAAVAFLATPSLAQTTNKPS